MKLINLNHISKEFAEKYYNNQEEDIVYDILDFTRKIRQNEEIDEYQTIKMLKAIMGYCGIKNVNINKYFKLSV